MQRACRKPRLTSPAFDGEARGNDGAVQAGVDREAFEVRQNEPNAEGVACAGRIHHLVCPGWPTVKTLGTRIVEDSTLCAALEDNKPKATADDARQRALRIRLHSLEQEFILTGKERVNIRQYFPPIVKRFIGDGEVRVDGNKPPLEPTERRDECALHVDGHRCEVKR
jgi:hypothetical protein